MSLLKTREYYLGVNGNKKHNCAQAVIAGFKDAFSLDDDLVAKFAACGGGRAPEGRCGALHAAQFILERRKSEDVKECEDTFFLGAGSVKCREIKSLKKLSCLGCVEMAAEFLENHNAGNTVKSDS